MEQRKIDSKHNNPPTDEQIFHDKLSEKHVALLDEGRALMKSAQALPAEVQSDEDEAAITQWVSDAKKYYKRLEDTRTDDKKPYFDAGKFIDSFFNKPKLAFDTARGKMETRLLAYKRAKAAKEEAARKEEAAKQAAAAEAARKAAEALKEAGDVKQAAVVEKQAERAEVKAERMAAPVAAGTTARSRTATGVTSGLKKTWVGEILPAPVVVDLEALRPYLSQAVIQTAVDAAVRAGVREIAGVKIYEKESVSVR